MIFSDLPSPAEASSHMTDRSKGFAQAGNRYPPIARRQTRVNALLIKSGAGFFGIML
jgi:hypothetical protein